jgi:hypothetical protein
MGKYGLFPVGSDEPYKTWDGDMMKQDGEFVEIWTRKPNSTILDEQVAAIRLEKGWSVRKISD